MLQQPINAFTVSTREQIIIIIDVTTTYKCSNVTHREKVIRITHVNINL